MINRGRRHCPRLHRACNGCRPRFRFDRDRATRRTAGLGSAASFEHNILLRLEHHAPLCIDARRVGAHQAFLPNDGSEQPDTAAFGNDLADVDRLAL